MITAIKNGSRQNMIRKKTKTIRKKATFFRKKNSPELDKCFDERVVQKSTMERKEFLTITILNFHLTKF